MQLWPPDLRLLAALGLVALGVIIGLALGNDQEPPVISGPPATTPGAAPATPAPPPATRPSAPAQPPTTAPSVPFRQPRPNEGVFTVTGTVTEIRIPPAVAPGTPQRYTLFVIRADSGPPLRAGAGGDLRQDPNVPRNLFEPACAGRVRARFKVAPARFTGAFDYGLLEVAVLRDGCSG